MPAPKPKFPKALQLEWPYEPGWHETKINGFMCIGESCVRRDAPGLPIGSHIYIGPGLGEIYCKACQFERRKKAN